MADVELDHREWAERDWDDDAYDADMLYAAGFDTSHIVHAKQNKLFNWEEDT